MSSIVLTGDTSGAITVSAPAIAGTNTITMPASSGTLANTPAFAVKVGTAQSLSETTITKVNFDTEHFDTDSAFNTTLNRFTVPTGKAGKYFISSFLRVNSETSSNLLSIQAYIYKNGSAYVLTNEATSANYTTAATPNLTAVLDLLEGDYIEIYIYLNTIDNTGGSVTAGYTDFSGYKLIT